MFGRSTIVRCRAAPKLRGSCTARRSAGKTADPSRSRAWAGPKGGVGAWPRLMANYNPSSSFRFFLLHLYPSPLLSSFPTPTRAAPPSLLPILASPAGRAPTRPPPPQLSDAAALPPRCPSIHGRLKLTARSGASADGPAGARASSRRSAQTAEAARRRLERPEGRRAPSCGSTERAADPTADEDSKMAAGALPLGVRGRARRRLERPRTRRAGGVWFHGAHLLHR